MKKVNNKLYNAVLPLFFYEWWYILIAFIFVVTIEAFIFSKFFRINFRLIWHDVLIMNICSTLGGFFIQGIIRIGLGLTLFLNVENYSKFPVLDIIFGNVGYPINSKITTEIIFDLIISLLITLIISIFMEYDSIKNNKVLGDFKNNKIFKGVIITNLISYTLLTIWIFYKLYNF